MRQRRLKLEGERGVYHCMSRTVNGECLFGPGEKEVLRKMIWQAADFSGVEVLTYCVMDNHFHVLAEVPDPVVVSDAELMRRYRVLYPKPTKHQVASAREMERILGKGGPDAESVRSRLLARMGDVSEYMKTLKQRFSVWYNRTHERYGTLWSERFKSVLVEGEGHPLQTMAAYIDLNAVRKGWVEDPKDYRWCGYAEAVAGVSRAVRGLRGVWSGRGGEALRAHRMLIFGKGSSPWTRKGAVIDRDKAVRVLEEEQGALPLQVVLRCRVRYFTDGAVLGSARFVRGLAGPWQKARGRDRPPEPRPLRGADWGDMAVIKGLRRRVFG